MELKTRNTRYFATTRIFALGLVFGLAFVFVGCSNDNEFFSETERTTRETTIEKSIDAGDAEGESGAVAATDVMKADVERGPGEAIDESENSDGSNGANEAAETCSAKSRSASVNKFLASTGVVLGSVSIFAEFRWGHKPEIIEALDAATEFLSVYAPVILQSEKITAEILLDVVTKLLAAVKANNVNNVNIQSLDSKTISKKLAMVLNSIILSCEANMDSEIMMANVIQMVLTFLPEQHTDELAAAL